MPAESAFAPYRLRPGALPAEAGRLAAEAAAQPIVVAVDEPLPAGMAASALAALPAWRAASPEEACRGADGSPSGAPGPARACVVSERHDRQLAEAAASALAGGFAGVCLDRPDASLALGLLGGGFCADCQRAFARDLTREYGDAFQPVDYLALAREAVAQASGAVSYGQLPFGRDFWRFRAEALSRALGRWTRAVRDAARDRPTPFEVAAHFEALGPAQLAAARHLDAAVFPAPLGPHACGAGLFRLLRAVMGRRACAASLAESTPGASLAALAGVAAACGIEVAPPAALEGSQDFAALRRFARGLAARRDAPGPSSPVVECAVLYSAEADLWSAGRHLAAVEQAGEVLAALRIQAPVVTRVHDAPPAAVLVLSGAEALSSNEARAVSRHLEAGGGVLAFGDVGAVDAAGRPSGPALPPGRASGVKVGKGTLAQLPALSPPREVGAVAPRLEPVERALSVLLGKGHRAASVVSRVPILVVLERNAALLDVHLVTLRGETAQGATLFLGLHVAGGTRRARFASADGADERISMNPSGYSISTVLPAFRGYAVLSVG